MNATVQLTDRVSHALHISKSKKCHESRSHGVRFAKQLVSAERTICPPPPAPDAKVGSGNSEGYVGMRLISPRPEHAARFRQHSEARAVAKNAVEQSGGQLSVNALCVSELCPELENAVGIALAAELHDAWDRSQRCSCSWSMRAKGLCTHVERADFPPVQELTSDMTDRLGVVIPEAAMRSLAAAANVGSTGDVGRRKPRQQRGSVLALISRAAGNVPTPDADRDGLAAGPVGGDGADEGRRKPRQQRGSVLALISRAAGSAVAGLPRVRSSSLSGEQGKQVL
eukprot:CAMPEP_0115874474 /NCGR_PEP_ID=MMETSP0287-20121206/24558_1 /TAXON_ID=412157 /ORGANISM="Chrysochromulina rotalis, Strain UIO044" /LENGTH=283 /DNA_ID=CAMNT_0003329623 /DNA_START=56 /DNA_END=907 /DNA_ORIENTATION=+